MAHKRRSPLRGPILTMVLMLASAGAVVAVGDRIDTRRNTQEPTASAVASNASAGQESRRQATGAMLGG
jgi:hypothetical protein